MNLKRNTLLIFNIVIGYCFQAQVLVYDIEEYFDPMFFGPPTGQFDYDTISVNFLSENIDFIIRYKFYDIGPMGYPDVFEEKMTSVLQNTDQVEFTSSFQGPSLENGNGIVFNNFCDLDFPTYWPSLWEIGGSWGYIQDETIGPNNFPLSGQALMRETIIGHDSFDLSIYEACGFCYQSLNYLGIRVKINGFNHYGYIKLIINEYEIFIDQIGINITPEESIMAGQIDEFTSPFGLNQSYTQSPEGIYLNWAVFPDAQACQVRGGPIGGNDPHNFIISTAPYNQLFINGSSLTVGEEYQWKVRCATGVNPYSGVSDWSEYDYFIYEP